MREWQGGDVRPHCCIGSARRIMVGERGGLAARMLEAVQNHGPEVVVVDEISNREEVDAARTISQRGVMLVATAHGTDLPSLLHNAELNALVGGLQTVTLGDMAARASSGGAKTRVERRGAPTFRTLVEVMGGGRLRLRPDVASSVDSLLSSGRGPGGGAGAGGAPLRPPMQQLNGSNHQQHAGGQRPSAACRPQHQQQPGSLLGLRQGGSGCGGVLELQPPLEQLRWTEGLAVGPAAGRRQQLHVRMLQPGEGAPEGAE
ncbi:hypothetical protein TSOC_012835 [Tetrabaena socialis]|uniref:Stage III sporulation protein AA n=1 Tax=Tetrabaena socialis TaxID=47790 RepID=A0A2J7ZLZ2_9CHLO|nr:hypothetical protein TSOC_012835 [Tetrabaena socialis]|eukprot:PNH01281.1 hypothetical protein TSOC_012835 [Tetrabaena socialis]